ncbi:MAG: hypothetical protein J0J00_05970 [Microbacterium sp.]|nr:hypothetical protein [Microbacterium sp.]
MSGTAVEHDVTLWMVNDIPVRMFYAGRRWRVSDMPTRLTESVWAMPLEGPRHMSGWRFQATDDAGISLVFDVYREKDDWHVHHAYD